MEAIAKQFKTDFIAIGIISAFILICFGVSYLKWLHPIIDCGREAYVPWQLMTGKMLYKDLAYFYGPFAPYFIAIIFKFFGATLTTLYTIGIITNIILCGLLYFMSRQILTPLCSAITILLFVQIGVIAPNLGSYEGFIYPYSFAALFGLLFILMQIVTIVVFLKFHKSDKLLYLSGFFSALSICCKQDYALSTIIIVFLFLFYLIKTRQHFKSIFIYLLITFIIPVLSYSVFFFYTPLDLLINRYLFPMNIITSEHSKTLVVSFFSFHHLLISTKNFLFTGSIILLTLIIVYFVWLSIGKLKLLYPFRLKDKLSPFVIYGILCVGFFLIVEEAGLFFIKNIAFIDQNLNHIHYISWFPVFASIIIAYYAYKYFFQRKEFSENDLYFCIITLAGIIVSIRCYAYCFTSYLVMPLMISMVYLFTVKLPEICQKSKFISFKAFQNSVVTVLILFLILFTGKNFITFMQQNYFVNTPYGTFKTFKAYADGYNSALSFIQDHVAENDQITVFPEETLINFLTRHSSPTRMSQYMDINDMMMSNAEYQYNIDQLKHSKYVLISNFPYFLKQPYFFGVNYHNKLAEWIKQHYNLVAVAGKYETNYKEQVNTYGFLIFKNKIQ